jgi:transposase-like protein
LIRARSEGIELVGPDGMLSGLTKTGPATVLAIAEMTAHLGYDKHDPVGAMARTRSTHPGLYSAGRNQR